LMSLLAAEGLRDGPALSVPPRQLVRMFMEAWPPAMLAAFWDAPQTNPHPSMSFWRLGEIGLLMRCWHLYPVFIYPDREPAHRGSIDDDLIVTALSNPHEQCAAIEDSDDGMFLDVLDENKPFDNWVFDLRPHPASVEFVSAWAHEWSRPIHRELLRKFKFWLHKDELRREDWRDVERESDRIIDDIVAKVPPETVGTKLP